MIETLVTVIILCTNANWEHSPRCTAPVEHFEMDALGNFHGHLETGVEFTQTRLTAELHLFRMENVCWLVSGNTTVYCDPV